MPYYCSYKNLWHNWRRTVFSAKLVNEQKSRRQIWWIDCKGDIFWDVSPLIVIDNYPSCGGSLEEALCTFEPIRASQCFYDLCWATHVEMPHFRSSHIDGRSDPNFAKCQAISLPLILLRPGAHTKWTLSFSFSLTTDWWQFLTGWDLIWRMSHPLIAARLTDTTQMFLFLQPHLYSPLRMLERPT
jgi:hypothetical protein